MMLYSKSGQSEVISTVLMILIVIVAVALVMAFVIPFVMKQTNKSSCFDVIDKIEVVNGQYTCYNTSTNQMNVQIHLLDVGTKIKGFGVVLGGATSKSYQIINLTRVSGITMYNMSDTLYLPQDNGAETYRITTTQQPDSINVFLIMKDGSNCQASNSLTSINTC